MDIKREDFPLYGLLETLNNPGFDSAKADMEAAEQGDDKAAYGLVMGLHAVAWMPNAENMIPGLTEDVKQATTLKCRDVWAELAKRGHAPSQNLMTLLNNHPHNPGRPGTPQP